MGQFNYCYKLILKSDVSHAWIHLHRCVEALARTTGESYNNIFSRIENEFKFSRTNKRQWPDITTITAAANYLKIERDTFLIVLNNCIAERKKEKKNGIRYAQNEQFILINKKQQAYIHIKMRPYGWRKRRQNKV